MHIGTSFRQIQSIANKSQREAERDTVQVHGSSKLEIVVIVLQICQLKEDKWLLTKSLESSSDGELSSEPRHVAKMTTHKHFRLLQASHLKLTLSRCSFDPPLELFFF
jgi:hypothetical protein